MKNRLTEWKQRFAPLTETPMSDRFRSSMLTLLSSEYALPVLRSNHPGAPFRRRRGRFISAAMGIALIAIAVVPTLTMPAQILPLFRASPPSFSPPVNESSLRPSSAVTAVRARSAAGRGVPILEAGWLIYHRRVYIVTNRLVERVGRTDAQVGSVRLGEVPGVNPDHALAVRYQTGQAQHLARFAYPQVIRFRGRDYRVLHPDQGAHPDRVLGEVNSVFIYRLVGILPRHAIGLLLASTIPPVTAEATSLKSG